DVAGDVFGGAAAVEDGGVDAGAGEGGKFLGPAGGFGVEVGVELEAGGVAGGFGGGGDQGGAGGAAGGEGGVCRVGGEGGRGGGGRRIRRRSARGLLKSRCQRAVLRVRGSGSKQTRMASELARSRIWSTW